MENYHLANVLVGYASDDVFPLDEEVSAARLQPAGLPMAYETLESTKKELEVQLLSTV